MLFRLFSKKINKPVDVDKQPGSDFIENAEPILFDHLKISMQGMTREQEVIEAGKTEDGAYVEYYISRDLYNEETESYEENKLFSRRIDGNQDLYGTLCKMLGSCDIISWDGFYGANPPGMLDGESGSFEALLSDGRKIQAGGSNNFPKNFHRLYKELMNMATISAVESGTVSGEYFSVEVPREWIGDVKVKHSPGMFAFFVTDSNGTDLLFMIFDYESYWYGDDKYTHVGVLREQGKEDGTEYKIVARRNTPLKNYYDTLSEEQKKVCDSFEICEQSIIDSFKGINGYQLYPEKE